MYSEKLAQFKNTADPKIISAIQNAKTEDSLRKVIEKYRIHIDVAEEAFSALMLMCYGVMQSSECFNIIHSMNAVPETEFVNFIQDVNSQILNPIQEQIKKSVTADFEARESSYKKELENPTVEDTQNTEDFFVSLGLNPDGSPKESAEETLARIEREVDDEIDHEIELEMQAEEQKKVEAAAKNQTIESKQASFQEATKKINADIDLDDIPKTESATYHFENNFTPEPKNEVVVGKQINEPLEPSVQSTNDEIINNMESVKSNALDFIESRATGNIKLQPEPKKAEAAKNNYYKDPYKEEL